ncbi:hypothetical protein MNBD_CHLOROFLEXI01-172 [hydrothermal vent metagenome]|uniref:Uncharacterized protein n=1 Tax=hydrothermal vent metagenome TaxID=652676 RepID=A0A3B0VH14_9ZZZZ
MKKKIIRLYFVFFTMAIMLVVYSVQASPLSRTRVIKRDLGEGRIVTIHIEEFDRLPSEGEENGVVNIPEALMSPNCTAAGCVDAARIDATCSNGARLKYHVDHAHDSLYRIYWQDYWWGGNPSNTSNTMSCSAACNITIETNWSAYYTLANVWMDDWHFDIDSWVCK